MELPDPGPQEAQPAWPVMQAARPATPGRTDGTPSLDSFAAAFLVVVILAILVVATVVVISIFQNGH